MSEQHWDVVIVGAGPVGSFAAWKLSERGHKVLLLEEHSEIGRPFQCAGLVTPRVMKTVGLHDTVLSDIFGARIHSPSGVVVPVGTGDEIKTHVVCRKLFDQGITRLSLSTGAQLWLLSHPVSCDNEGEIVSLTINRNGVFHEITTSLLIGADGAHSWVRRTLKLGNPKEWMFGFQVEVTGYEGKNGWLEMFTGQSVAPGLFAWVIPNGMTHRIGVWSITKDLGGRSCEQLIEYLMNESRWKDRFTNCRETARHCGPIPAGLIKRPWANRTILIGDAAGLAKPTTGGGIGPGISQVESILEGLSRAISDNKLSSRDLKRIQKPMEKVRKEQERSRALRDFFVSKRTDAELDENFTLFSRPEVLELINVQGDIEKPVALGMALIREVPKFRMLALKAGFALLRG